MELKDATLESTVKLMCSDDYKDRLLAEVMQLTIRARDLMKYLKTHENPKLRWQLMFMQGYLEILITRLDELNQDEQLPHTSGKAE